jgi:hypothetical protein
VLENSDQIKGLIATTSAFERWHVHEDFPSIINNAMVTPVWERRQQHILQTSITSCEPAFFSFSSGR